MEDPDDQDQAQVLQDLNSWFNTFNPVKIMIRCGYGEASGCGTGDDWENRR